MSVVLIVEDEFLIRLNTVEMVEAAGYEALEASNADEALDILTQRPDIAIVFTDVNMPGSLNGLQLAETIAESWPGMHVVLTSGRYILRDQDLPDDGRFILKPYSASQVAHVLHDVEATR